MAQQEPVSFQGLVSCDTSLCISTMRLGAIGEKLEAKRLKILSASTTSDGESTSGGSSSDAGAGSGTEGVVEFGALLL